LAEVALTTGGEAGVGRRLRGCRRWRRLRAWRRWRGLRRLRTGRPREERNPDDEPPPHEYRPGRHFTHSATMPGPVSRPQAGELLTRGLPAGRE
jgi:hypothetical protein